MLQIVYSNMSRLMDLGYCHLAALDHLDLVGLQALVAYLDQAGLVDRLDPVELAQITEELQQIQLIYLLLL